MTDRGIFTAGYGLTEKRKPIEEQPFKNRQDKFDPGFQQFSKELQVGSGSGAQQFLDALGIMPFLQQYGGLFPGSRESIRQLLPEGAGFISPLETGPFGSTAEQFQKQRSSGRSSLSQRGLLGSGAEQSFNDASGLQEAQANRQIVADLIRELPFLLQQSRTQALQNRAMRGQISDFENQPTFAEQLGGNLAGQALGSGMSLLAGLL